MSDREEILRALVELQLSCLTPAGQPHIDDAGVVADEVLTYVQAVPQLVRDLFYGALERIETAGREQFGKDFDALTLDEREAVLDEIWGDHLWHELVSLAVRLGWLVIYSREPARKRIGFSRPTDHAVGIPPPPAPNLDATYDVCVVGSGAGGAIVAARAAEQGKRVLIVDDGPWISPQNFPVRDDQALRVSYRNAGIQPALPELDFVLRPGHLTFMNVFQARVVGGGPAVNNAIHIPISSSRFDEWRTAYECPLTWAEMQQQLQRVVADLGIGTSESRSARGERSQAFFDAARRLGLGAEDLPVSLHRCIGCGGCNVGCRFGRKTGGLHGPRPAGAPRSYLERALASTTASVASRVRARSFEADLLANGGRIRRLFATDLEERRDVRIRAQRFVLAAGPIASSLILRRSGFQLTSPVGRHLAANVVMPVFAIMSADFAPGRPDPGLQMCVFVDQGGRLLETWFHYPGSLAAALPEWLKEHTAIMDSYRRLAACGVVVPTARRGEIGPTGNLVLSLSDAELKQMVDGACSVAEVFFEAGATTVIPSTLRPVYLRKQHWAGDRKRFRQSVRGPADLALATSHPQGGNAIGRHRSRSVVSGEFALFDFKNLFVADASLFPAGCNVNPQMTAMALAHLAADEVLKP